MRKVAVTGGYGFLGSHVADELKSRDYDVSIPGRLMYDLRNPRHVRMMLDRYEPDAIVHCAARVGGIGANVAAPGEFFYDNIQMGVNLLEAVKTRGVKVLTIGTACMYPEFGEQREDKLYNGRPAYATAPYAYAKRAILEMGQAYRDQYGTNATFVIPTNLYGPRDHFNAETGHVIPAMIRKFDGTDKAVLYGTGMPTRDFLFVTDAARGIIDALERYDQAEPMNLGSGASVSIKELAETVAKTMGFEGKIHWDKGKPDGTPYRQLDIERAKQEIDWEPQVSLLEGLDQTIAWFRDHG